MSEPMNIPQETKHLSELEKKLENFYNMITPDPAFVHTLDVQIARVVKHMPSGRPGFAGRLKNAFQRRPVLAFGLAVLVAIITPSVDAISMILVFMPLFALFELSILLAWLAERRRAKRVQKRET